LAPKIQSKFTKFLQTWPLHENFYPLASQAGHVTLCWTCYVYVALGVALFYSQKNIFNIIYFVFIQMPSNNSIKIEEHNNSTIIANEGKEEQSLEGNKVESGKWAVIQSIIKQVRNGTPIYRVQLPIFLQEPRSLLERYSDFCTHMDIFTRYHPYQSIPSHAHCHASTPLNHNSTPQLHTTTPHHNSTPQLHTTTPHHNSTPQLHTTTPPQLHHNSTTTPPQLHHNSTTIPPQFHHNSTRDTPDTPYSLSLSLSLSTLHSLQHTPTHSPPPHM
jgi:hypothetical protein